MNTRGKTSLKNLILLLILVSLAIFLFKPAWDEYSTAKGSADQVQTDLNAAQQKVLEIRNGQASGSGTSEVEKLTLEQKIPSDLNQPDLIKKMKDFAERSDLSLNSVNFANLAGMDVAAGQLGRVTINANLTGGFDGLLSFLRVIEESERKFIVKNITVQKGETQGVLRVNFSLTLESYYLAS